MKLKLGYSCWGFLGNGIVDTPDGGRSHRLTLIKELISLNTDVVMLQKNRDLLEAGENFSERGLSFNQEMPQIDVLFIEYRWPIPGRNCHIKKSSKNYTPDLDKQNELLNYYKHQDIPIIIWDKDQKLPKNYFADLDHVTIFEPALKPRFNRRSLLFSIDSKKCSKAIKKISNYSKNRKINQLIYIGNQYERDRSFKNYINVPASSLNSPTQVFGNWNKYPKIYKKNLLAFPNVKFKGRINYKEVQNIYEKSFCTVLIAPERYYQTGHFTQRLFESLWGLCLPLCPDKYSHVNKVIDRQLQVKNGKDTLKKIKKLLKYNDEEIKKIIKRQFKLLNIFSATKQAEIIIETITSFYKI